MSARDRRRQALPVQPALLRTVGRRTSSSDVLSPTLRCKVEVIASGKGHRATAIVPRPPSKREPSCEMMMTIGSPVESKENDHSLMESVLGGGEGNPVLEQRNPRRRPRVAKTAPERRVQANIQIREQPSPVSDYFDYKVEDTPNLALEEDGDEWVASVSGPGLHRYPSIFEDYYGESSPVPPDSPLHTIESLRLAAATSRQRPTPQRQTTVDEQGTWGEFWTDAMRRRGTEKQKPSLLKRTDTLEVSALLKHRRQLAKEGRENLILEEEEL